MTETVEKINVSQHIIDDINNTDGKHELIAFNNDYTSAQLVIAVLSMTVPLSFAQSYTIASRIHNIGQAIVYQGCYSHCVKISEALSQIGVKTIIQKLP